MSSLPTVAARASSTAVGPRSTLGGITMAGEVAEERGVVEREQVQEGERRGGEERRTQEATSMVEA